MLFARPRAATTQCNPNAMQQPINANDSTFAVLPVGVSLRLELINKAKTKKTIPDSKFEFRGTSEGEGGLPASQWMMGGGGCC